MARPADPNARVSLLAAARAEFVKKGIRGARIEDITAACGLSKGAFYLHFESKEALFGELVGALKRELDVLTDGRFEAMRRFNAEWGAMDLRDVAQRSERYRRLVELETAQDLQTLELMWAYRDVMDVLLRGSQGTAFESLVWTLTDREVERIVVDYRRLLGPSSEARDSVQPEMFGSLIVGTYMLLCRRMAEMKEKPDLAAWARTLQLLVREGCMPCQGEPVPAPDRPRRPATSQKPSARQPAKARAATRRTSRKRP
ncbi:helix-turn-helix domain containing protein [Myxococcaceae bacterium GXIMD 01537]